MTGAKKCLINHNTKKYLFIFKRAELLTLQFSNLRGETELAIKGLLTPLTGREYEMLNFP